MTRRASVTCAVQWPGSALAIGPGCMCGRHSRCTSACTSSSSAVGTSSRASTPWPCRRPTAPRSGTASETGRQRPQQRVHLGVDPLGDGQRRVRPCSQAPDWGSRLAQRVPDAPDRRLGVRVEDQLDGVDHVDQARDPLSGRMPPRSSIRSQRRSSTRTRGQHRPHRRQPASASRLPISAAPGCSGHAPITSPAHGMPWAASASSVSAVWFSVPSPGATTTSTGAARSARGRAASHLARRSRPAAHPRPRPG